MTSEQHRSSELPLAANMTTQELVDLAVTKAAESIALFRAASQKESDAFTHRSLELGLDPITIVGCTDKELVEHSSKIHKYNRAAVLMRQVALFATRSSLRRRQQGRTRFLD